MVWLQKNKLILLLAIIKFILPFVLINPVWELHRDEYLYFQQGQHLALGYLENPPLVGLLARFSAWFGGSFIAIKIWPALFGALTLIVTSAIAREFGGKLFAQSIAATGILFSAYMRVHFLFQPNFLDIFFWTLAAYYLVRYINTQQNKYFYLTGLALALGWWSKYSVVFFIVAMILSLLLTKDRTVFTKKHFWFAMLLTLVFISPNIAWQYNHKFPLIHHMNELRETQLRYIDKSDFLKGQLLLLFPVLIVWLGGLVWTLMNNRYRIIGYMYLFIIFLLIIGSGKNYYSLGAYPMMLAAGGVWLENLTVRKIWIRYAVLLVILLLALPSVPLLIPMQLPADMASSNKKYNLAKIGVLKWEDLHDHPLQQDFADMIGWKELSEKSNRFYNSLDDSVKSNTIIYCRSYGQAGALKYYGQDKNFRQSTICDNGTFLLWIPDSIEFKNLIFVGRHMPDKDDEVFNHFEKITLIDSVTNSLSRQWGDKIIFFQNTDSMVTGLVRRGLNLKKSEFQR